MGQIRAEVEEMKEAMPDLDLVVKSYFGIDLFPYQKEIIESIFSDDRKVTIRATTRAGKSYSVALAALLFALCYPGKKVGIIAPTQHKTKIIMGYIGEFLSLAPDLIEMLDMNISGKDITRLKRETSKQRITFVNGSSIEVLTADLPSGGQGLMGRAYHLTIVDESAEISAEAYSKIYRMLVESKDAKLVEIYNPWYLNHTYEHFNDESWKKIHIDWRRCVKEGRLHENDIMDQKRNLTELEFSVLYDANFPKDIENSIFSQQGHIENAIRKKEFKLYDRILIGVDVARGGKDYTVITIVGEYKGDFSYIEYKKMDTNDIMKVVGMTTLYADKYKAYEVKISVDTVGLGAGVHDRLKEMSYNSTAFSAGSRARNKSRFYNIKAETIFELADIMKEGKFYNLPYPSEYALQLKKWIFEVRSDRQLRVIDPEDKSPDFADSLAITFNRPQQVLVGSIDL